MTGRVPSTQNSLESHTLRRTMLASEEMMNPGRESVEEGGEGEGEGRGEEWSGVKGAWMVRVHDIKLVRR